MCPHTTSVLPEHLGHELSHFVLRRPLRRLAGLSLRCNLLGDVYYLAGIESEEVGDERNDDTANAQAAADPHSASIFNVAAGLLVAKLHGSLRR